MIIQKTKKKTKTNQTEFWTRKVIKRKSGKLYVKGYDNSYNKCINKKDVVL